MQFDISISVILFLLGASLASFFNAQIYRIEKGMGIKDLAMKPSHCEKCGRPLTVIELIPIIGWIIGGGKCSCGYKVPLFYPLTELFFGLVLVLLYLYQLPIIYFLLFVLVGFLALYDLQYQGFPSVVMDAYLILSVIYFITLSLVGGQFIADGYFVAIPLVAGLMFINIFKPSFGAGDLLLLLFFGAFLGWIEIVALFWFAAVIGGVIGIVILIIRRGERDIRIPFVPFLLLGLIATLILKDFYLPFFDILNLLW